MGMWTGSNIAVASNLPFDQLSSTAAAGTEPSWVELRMSGSSS